MKKILSIILALGLVLSMSLAALPAAAQTACGEIDPVEVCAGDTEVYTITFALPKTMLMGNDAYVIEFPAGFTFTPAFIAGDITVGGIPVPLAYLTVAAPVITILAPQTENPQGTLTIVIPNVKASTTVGEYTVKIGIDRDCCPFEAVCEVDLEVIPKKSTYKLYIDHGVTPAEALAYPSFPGGGDLLPLPVASPSFYDGITLDYFPPTQYCTFNFWVVMIDYLKEGCEAWDDEAQVRITLVDAPEGAVVTFWIFGFNPLQAWHGPYVSDPFDPAEDPQEVLFPEVPFILNLAYIANNWNMTPVLSHSTMPGEYTFSIELFTEVEIQLPCDEEDSEEMLLAAKKTYTHIEYQHLDSFDFEDWDAKWNFFSTPLRLLNDAPSAVFEPVEDNLVMVLHAELLADGTHKWFHFSPDSDLPDSYQPLNKINDGKGYLVRMMTDGEGYTPGDNNVMWLFGQKEGYAPALPFQYGVRGGGWTMMGYTSLVSGGNIADYLYPAAFSAVMELDGSSWVPANPMEPGKGYLVWFNAAGLVVPSVPVP